MDEVFGACPSGSIAKDARLLVMGADQGDAQAERVGNGTVKTCEEIRCKDISG